MIMWRQFLAFILSFAVATPSFATGAAWVNPVARSVPFDNSASSFTETDVQNSLEALRARVVNTATVTATSAAGTLTLTEASNSLQILTGTATGYSVVLPNATTLFNGRKFEIINQGSQNVLIKDNGGTTLLTLGQTSIAYGVLQSNGTTNGTWVIWQVFVSSLASGILNYQVADTTAFTSASTTDVLVTGFTVTPQAGTYAVWVNVATQSTSGTAANSGGIYKAAVAVVGSDRTARMAAANAPIVLSTMSIITFNGSETCDFRVRTSAASQTVNARTMLLIRLGS